MVQLTSTVLSQQKNQISKSKNLLLEKLLKPSLFNPYHKRSKEYSSLTSSEMAYPQELLFARVKLPSLNNKLLLDNNSLSLMKTLMLLKEEELVSGSRITSIALMITEESLFLSALMNQLRQLLFTMNSLN